MADSMEVGDRLRVARERRGMTIGDLAAKMGVHVGTVTLWENRKNRRQMGTKHLRNAAEALGISVSELLGETEHTEARHGLVTRDVIEDQILRMFRLMPEKLQLFQLAQFINTVNLGEAEHTGRHSHGQGGTLVVCPEDSEAR